MRFKIIYEKEAAKHINKMDKKEQLLTDEIEAIRRANESIEKYGTVDHNTIDWD